MDVLSTIPPMNSFVPLEVEEENALDHRNGSPDEDILDQDESDQEEDAGEREDDEPHRLQNKWALWFYKHDQTNSWTENLKKVVEVDTVEEFWGLINHVQTPSRLSSGCDYSLFKEGIQPMWEDKANQEGGSWTITLDKTQRFTQLDTYWLEMLMLLIGEAFDEDGEQVCGVVVNIRGKGDRIGVWTANCSDQDAILRIGKRIKEALQQKVPITYQSHVDQQNKNSSKAKSMFTL